MAISIRYILPEGRRKPDHTKGYLKMPLASLRDYLRPWKLFSLACGIAILIAGSYFQPAPDWDIPVSFLMAFSTYLFSPVTSRTLARRQWKHLPLALFGMWFSVDGIYWLYWSWRSPEVLEMMRSGNAPASACLYGLCAMIWLHDGTLREVLRLKK